MYDIIYLFVFGDSENRHMLLCTQARESYSYRFDIAYLIDIDWAH